MPLYLFYTMVQKSLAAYKGYWAGGVTGVGVSSLFRSPATLDRNNSVTVAPIHFCFALKKPEVESFRSRGRLSESSKNWPRNENFGVIVSEVGWLSPKWYGGENALRHHDGSLSSMAACHGNTYKVNYWWALVGNRKPHYRPRLEICP